MGIDAQMYFTTCAQLSDAQISEMQWRLAEAFWRDRPLWIRPPEEDSKLDWLREGRKSFAEISTYHQDGPTVRRKKGERMFEVSLSTRYYSEGYERGDIIGIIAARDWICTNIPDARVFYGGDSSGVEAEELTRERCDELIEHWAKHGHVPYASGWGRIGGEKQKGQCGFCNATLIEHGWGQGKVWAFCPGCGQDFVTTDQGKTWAKSKGPGEEA